MAENTQVANFNTQLSYYTNRYVDLMERDLTSRGMEFDSYSKDCVVAAMGSIFQMVHESGVSFEAINGSTYLGDGKWGSVEAYGFAYYPVIAWQPMPPAYKPGR